MLFRSSSETLASKKLCTICDYFDVARQPGCQRCSGSLLYTMYRKINFIKSPASRVGNASGSKLLSQVGRMREVVCA